jgi:predicted ATPase
MLTRLEIHGYRSLQRVCLPLSPLTVVTGPNGSGKSNLYRALALVHRGVRGELARALAEEGGLPSALWSGPRRRLGRGPEPVRLTVGVQGDDYGYEFACGLPQPSDSRFHLDPEVKTETAWLGPHRRPSMFILERDHGSLHARSADNTREHHALAIDAQETALAQVMDARRYPDLASLRARLLSWRFYHHFRCDADSPLRHPRTSTRTVALADDGADLAAALQTILEVGDAAALGAAVDRLQPGARLEIVDTDGQCSLEVRLQLPGLLRPLRARELSDGQLRYLALAAALLSPRPGELLAFNEPEASLHPDLLSGLAELCVRAARESQVWVTTHARPLAEALAEAASVPALELSLGERGTEVLGLNGLGQRTSDED